MEMTSPLAAAEGETPAPPRRWRFRISTMMMLVVIVGLTLALVIEHQKRRAAEEQARGAQAVRKALSKGARATASPIRIDPD
jgi:hypothetical protein